jgi:hypothetical protein
MLCCFSGKFGHERSNNERGLVPEQEQELELELELERRLE